MSEGRALLTDREREALRGEESDNYRYKTRTYFKQRLEKLEEDLTVLQNHDEELLDALREVVCDSDTPADAHRVKGGVDTSLDDPPQPLTVDDADREQLKEALAGSGDLLDRRADEILKMYDVLRDRGEAEKGDLLDAVDVEATGYASLASVWSNMVKGRDTLRALPGVKTPRGGMSKWRYTPNE